LGTDKIEPLQAAPNGAGSWERIASTTSPTEGHSIQSKDLFRFADPEIQFHPAEQTRILGGSDCVRTTQTGTNFSLQKNTTVILSLSKDQLPEDSSATEENAIEGSNDDILETPLVVLVPKSATWERGAKRQIANPLVLTGS